MSSHWGTGGAGPGPGPGPGYCETRGRERLVHGPLLLSMGGEGGCWAWQGGRRRPGPEVFVEGRVGQRLLGMPGGGTAVGTSVRPSSSLCHLRCCGNGPESDERLPWADSTPGTVLVAPNTKQKQLPFFLREQSICDIFTEPFGLQK